MNKVILLGHLTRAIELRYTANGNAVGNFGIASNRKFVQGGDLKEEVCFVDCVVFGKQAEASSQHLGKGSKVLIDGRLQQQRWETEDGQKRSKHVVVVERITYLSTRGEQGDTKGSAQSEYLPNEFEEN
jgi:single-strand DNA-binding protein